MKLILANYKEGQSFEVTHEYDPKKMDLEFVDLKYTTPLKLKGVVEKGPDTLFFRGAIAAGIEKTCGRCLAVVEQKIKQSFDLIYEIKNKEEIDTTDDFRELLIVDHPISFICRDNCKGLCPVCGVNRNDQKCKCKASKEAKHSSFENLKEAWNKKMKEKSHGKS